MEENTNSNKSNNPNSNLEDNSNLTTSEGVEENLQSEEDAPTFIEPNSIVAEIDPLENEQMEEEGEEEDEEMATDNEEIQNGEDNSIQFFMHNGLFNFLNFHF